VDRTSSRDERILAAVVVDAFITPTIRNVAVLGSGRFFFLAFFTLLPNWFSRVEKSEGSSLGGGAGRFDILS
jgi:hypothetical protein